jgi:twinkle protein
MDKAFRVLPGQFVVVTGVPNHGKSQWLDQLAVQMARLHGWKWAVFSPEGGSAEHHIATLAEIWLGAPFHEGPTQRMTEDQLGIACNWIRDHFTFINAKKQRRPSTGSLRGQKQRCSATASRP